MVEQEAPTATILVADDNWADLEPLSNLLQDRGCRVLCVVDGKQAVQAFRTDRLISPCSKVSYYADF